MSDFRFRQVHLDFHTSALIPAIGDKFNKEEWQNALKLGHVDSITVFSKCHHGYSYHPSEVNEMQPNLKFDLLKAELEACAEIGVRAPVYISAGLDEKDAVAHPEWVARDIDDFNEPVDYDYAGWHLLCFNTPYFDKLLAEVDEVMRLYKPCEIFLDIVGERVCYCDNCRRDMAAQGYDYNNIDDAKAFGRKLYRHYLDEIERVVRKYSPDTTIFQNSGHVLKGRRDLIDTMAHLELESLPTGGWGYDHFPMSASYARTQREDFLGMTGKFHGTWGEFGGFKHPNALRYEAALSLAMGGGCSIGDQMHPEGKLNESTFKLIGSAYKEVEEKEPWCKGAKAVAEFAVLSAECLSPDRNSETEKSDIGANRILLETGRLYNFIDTDEDFSKYKLIILPDHWRINDKVKSKLDEFLKNGGKLLLSGISGTDDNGEFVFDTGVKFIGKNEFNPTYFIPAFETVNGTTEYLMRDIFYKFENIDADVFAYMQNPYFNRTPEHFCSHQHAPNNRDFTAPAAVIKGNIAYIGWDIFRGYGEFGDFHHKEIVDYAIKKLMDNDFIIETTLPDRGIVSVMQQDNRKIIHLLFAHTTKRGEKTEVIEDLIPLYNVNVTLKCDKPSAVTIVPEGRKVDFTYENGKLSFTVDKVDMHCMISVEQD